MRCYGDVDATPTITSLQGVTLPPLLCLRSRVSLQHPDESCETHYISGRKGRCCTTCRPTEGHAGGAAAGVQAVPVHPEASTHWNTERICRWDYFSLKGIKNRRLSVDADAFWDAGLSLQIFLRSRSKGGVLSSPGPSGAAPPLTWMNCPSVSPTAACSVSRSAPFAWRTLCQSQSWWVSTVT